VAGGFVGVVALFLAVFIWKLFTVPIAMADEAEQQRLALETQLGAEANRREKIEELSQFLAQGEAIRGRFADRALPDTIATEYGPWVYSVSQYLAEVFDEACATQFQSARGNAMMGVIAGRSAGRGGHWQDIGGKCQWLDRFISDLRRH
jgi:hypothetical protein